MKKITFYVMLLISGIGFSQELLTNGDFQTGTSAPWTGNAANVVDLGGGTYVNQAEVTAAGNPWDANLSHPLALESGKTYKLVFDAYTDATTGSRTIVAGIGESADDFQAVTQTPTLTASSQTFTYEMTVSWNDVANSRVLFDMGAATGFVFIDNVSLTEVAGGGGGGGSATAPSTAPTAPPARDSGDVLSIYGEAYGDALGLAGVTWDNGSESVEETHANNKVLKITSGTGDFIGFDLPSQQDATSMTHVHVDFWISGDYIPGQVFKVKLSNHGNGTSETNAIIKEKTDIAASDKETWLSIDAELGADAREKLAQILLIFTTASNVPGTMYIDNLYLYKNGSTGGGGGNDDGAPTTKSPNPPTFTNSDDVSVIYVDGSNSASGLNLAPFGGASITDVLIESDASLKLEVPTAGGGANLQFTPMDLTTNGLDHLYFNYYTEATGVGKVFNINIQGGGANFVHTIALPASKSENTGWQKIDLAFSSMTDSGNGAVDNITQVQITGAGPDNPIGTIYLDNVMFYKGGTASVENNELLGFSMYPNPANNILNISAKETIQKADIFNVLGKRVMSVNINKTNDAIDVSDLASGIYLIKYNVNDKVGTAKFIKE